MIAETQVLGRTPAARQARIAREQGDSRRTERMELGGYSKRSRKRTQDRIRRMDPGRGPGDRKRDNADGSRDDAAEPHLYMTEEEREAWKEEQRLKKEEEKERLRIKKEKEQEKEERRRLRREEREKEKQRELRRRERDALREAGEYVEDSPESRL